MCCAGIMVGMPGNTEYGNSVKSVKLLWQTLTVSCVTFDIQCQKCDESKVCNPCCEPVVWNAVIGWPVGDLIPVNVN